jgi:adenylosuccinate synthase
MLWSMVNTAVLTSVILERLLLPVSNVIVVGAQWGDEGKAKITDLLAEQASWVVRCQGGCNAGHTVKHLGETYKFHLVPSGILYKGKHCVIASGVVIDPDTLKRELDDLQSRGITLDGLLISDRAHVTLPIHIAQDKQQESDRDQTKGQKIGTTGRGIGPTYMDKVGRMGLRVGDLLLPEAILSEKLATILSQKGLDTAPEALTPLVALCLGWKQWMGPYITDTVPVLDQATHTTAGQNVLFEGAQGTLLDVDFGTYPFVTSSNAISGGACTGSGVGPTRIDATLGVMKAYATRVGEGPFPTELTNATGDYLVKTGQEFGTTTGRMRRCGWFDAVVGRYSVQVNGLDGIALTKLDVLDDLDEIEVCVAYQDTKTGETIQQFPGQLHQLSHMTPIYETLPGWKAPTTHIRAYDDLPTAAKRYIERLAQLMACPIWIISVGPGREQTIIQTNPMQLGKRQWQQQASSTLVATA